MRHEHDEGGTAPFPTYAISNMEWVPPGPTPKQLLAERLIAEECAQRAKRHGMTRAQFLRTAAATATAFMVLNKLHGSSAFAVRKEHCDDLDAARELLDKKYFVMDVQQHHIDLERFPNLGCFLRFRDRMAAGGCPANLGQMNFVKEVFVDSETDVGVISGLPYGGVPLGPAAMIETRDLVNSLAGSERCLAQAVCDPAPGYEGGATSIASLEGQVAKGARAVKCYTYSGNWRLDDERVAYPMFEEMQRLGLGLLNVHKGLPATFAPGSQETVRTTDFPKAVRDWPNLRFCAYHSGYFTAGDDHPTGKLGSSEFLDQIALMTKKERKRVYAEIGSTFAIVLGRGPSEAARFLGDLLKALGPRNILWGTDSIWWGSPQWLIDAFKALRMPQELLDQGYPQLTDKVKRRILGLNSARLYGVKPKAERCTIPPDRLAMLQEEQGGARAGRRLVAYGPRTRREFFAMLRAERRA